MRLFSPYIYIFIYLFIYLFFFLIYIRAWVKARYLNIFTDGSKQSNNNTASAVYIPYFNVQISKRIPDLCSVYTAELIALLLALNWIRDVKPSYSAIFTVL